MARLMFEDLKTWDRILVVGPQRAGTRITTEIIAYDTGHRFVPEERFHSDSLNRLWEILETGRNIVIQAPALTRYAHLLSEQDGGLFVVMCLRGLDAIKKSQRRIRWRWEPPEIIRYSGIPGSSQADVKYALWPRQKAQMADRCMEIDYAALADHPLWVPADQRKDFDERQTK